MEKVWKHIGNTIELIEVYENIYPQCGNSSLPGANKLKKTQTCFMMLYDFIEKVEESLINHSSLIVNNRNTLHINNKISKIKGSKTNWRCILVLWENGPLQALVDPRPPAHEDSGGPWSQYMYIRVYQKYRNCKKIITKL